MSLDLFSEELEREQPRIRFVCFVLLGSSTVGSSKLIPSLGFVSNFHSAFVVARVNSLDQLLQNTIAIVIAVNEAIHMKHRVSVPFAFCLNCEG